MPTLAPFPSRSRDLFPGFLPCLCLSSRNGCSRLSAQRSASPPGAFAPASDRASGLLRPCEGRCLLGGRRGFTPWPKPRVHPGGPVPRRRPSAAPAYRVLPFTEPGVPVVTAETRRIDVCSPIRLLSKTVVLLRAGSEQAEPRSLLLAVSRIRHPSFGKDTYPGRADDAPSGFTVTAPRWNAIPDLVTVRGPPRPSTCQVCARCERTLRAPVPDPVVPSSPMPRLRIEREGSFEDPPGGLTRTCDRTVVRDRSG